MRTPKKLAIVCMAVLAAGSLIAATACDEKEETSYKVEYVSGATDATGTAPAVQTYKEGETVILAAATTFAREGYTFTTWSDGTVTYDAASSYTMPAHDVTFTAQWEEKGNVKPEDPKDPYQKETLPTSTLVTQNGDATATWTAEYGTDAFTITAWVRDTKIFKEGTRQQNDSVTVYLSKAERLKGYSEKTLSILADAKGDVRVTDPASGSVKATSKVTAKADEFSLDGKKIAGWRIQISVPYSETEITAAAKNASIAVALTNASSAADATTEYDATFGADHENVYTYVCVTDNNSFAQNPDVLYSAFFGDAGTLVGSDKWDLEHDIRGGEGYIVLDEDDDADNYIYLRDSKYSEVYVEMQFHVTKSLSWVTEEGVTKYDAYPKFGIVLTSADGGQRAFYYVDALSNATIAGGTNIGVVNPSATGLGFATKTGPAWNNDWTTVGYLGETSENYLTTSDEEGNETENFVTLGVYRNGSTLRFFCNGEYVGETTKGIAGDAYFGVASLKMGLKVKGFTVKTTGLEQYRGPIQREFLILGDSYLDPAFFTHYAGMFEGRKATNIAVGGTKTDDWQDRMDELKQKYNPQKILVHIGVNNINDANESDETAAEKVTALLTALKTAFPNAEIYYIGIVDSPNHHDNADKYTFVNNAVKEIEGIEYIDLPAALVQKNGQPDKSWFKEGLHLSPNGYGVLEGLIAEAFGLEYETQDGLGSVTTEEGRTLAQTGGWHYDEEVGAWRNRGFGDNQLFISESYGSTVYAETKISLRASLNGEQFGKSGLLIQSDRLAYFFHINCNVYTNVNGEWKDHYAAVGYRYTDSPDWVWPETDRGGGDFFRPFGGNGYTTIGNDPYDYNTGEDHFVTLSLIKRGNEVYFYCNSTFVGGTAVETEFTADEKVTVSVYNFNMDMYAKEGYATTDPTEVSRRLIPAGNDHLIDGRIDDWTEEEKSNPSVTYVNEGRKLTVYATMGEYGVSIFYDVIHNDYVTTGNWWDATNVEFRLGANTTQRYVSATGAKAQVTAAKLVHETLDSGKHHTVIEIFVAYDLIAEYDKDSDYVPAHFAWKTGTEQAYFSTNSGNSTYWAPALNGQPVSEQTIFITHEGLMHTSEMTIDGKADDWEGLEWQNLTTENQIDSALGKAFLGEEGLYMIIEIKAVNLDLNRNNWSSWANNFNLEFGYNGTKPNFSEHNLFTRDMWAWTSRKIVIQENGQMNYSAAITQAAYTFVRGGGVVGSPDTITIEIFLCWDHLDAINCNPESQRIRIGIGSQIYTDKITVMGTGAGQAYVLLATGSRDVFVAEKHSAEEVHGKA